MTLRNRSFFDRQSDASGSICRPARPRQHEQLFHYANVINAQNGPGRHRYRPGWKRSDFAISDGRHGPAARRAATREHIHQQDPAG